jgi:hypothetical protein
MFIRVNLLIMRLKVKDDLLISNKDIVMLVNLVKEKKMVEGLRKLINLSMMVILWKIKKREMANCHY